MLLRDLTLILFISAIGAVAAYSQGLSSRDVVGTWGTGGQSMLVERNIVTGSTTPSRGSVFTYEFKANGTFTFVGLMNSTVYGCTTSIFNDKSGRYELSGSQITLIPSRNFWRRTNGCAPSQNMERNYTLERSVYDIRTKTDEYGKSYICLNNKSGESCYRREAAGIRQ